MNSFRKAAEKTFKKYDQDNSNNIDYNELASALNDVAKEIGIELPTKNEILDIMKDFDFNNDKVISLDEFIAFYEVIVKMKIMQ